MSTARRVLLLETRETRGADTLEFDVLMAKRLRFLRQTGRGVVLESIRVAQIGFFLGFTELLVIDGGGRAQRTRHDVRCGGSCGEDGDG